MKTSNGFTLVELVITVAILAITVSVAVPAFQSVVITNQVATQVNELVAGINLGRSEAVKRGRSIRLQAMDGDWAEGWQLCLDANANASCSDAVDTLIRQWQPTSTRVSISNSDSALSIDARGGIGASSSFSIEPQPGDCPAGALNARLLQISLSGHASVSKAACAAANESETETDSEDGGDSES